MVDNFTGQLQQSLAATLSPDPELRKQAEAFIENAQRQPGYCSALLEVSGNTQQDANVALAAAVQLGTLVEFHWKYYDDAQAEKISVPGFKWIILSE